MIGTVEEASPGGQDWQLAVRDLDLRFLGSDDHPANEYWNAGHCRQAKPSGSTRPRWSGQGRPSALYSRGSPDQITLAFTVRPVRICTQRTLTLRSTSIFYDFAVRVEFGPAHIAVAARSEPMVIADDPGVVVR